MRFLYYILFFCCLISVNKGIATIPDCRQVLGQTVEARIEDGDTILVIELQPVDFIAPREFTSRREARRYNRLVRNVKTVYPYAQLAGVMFREYLNELEQYDSERQRREFTREAEKNVRNTFEEDLKRLTFSQGLILLKLIDRETQHTSYDILKDFRGTFSAVFWQSFGRLFGFNLRTKYDPQGEDEMIEEIVQLIEAGII